MIGPSVTKRDKVSINQFVTRAVAAKVAALCTLGYIAQRSRRDRFDWVQKQVAEADLEPYESDHLPE